LELARLCGIMQGFLLVKTILGNQDQVFSSLLHCAVSKERLVNWSFMYNNIGGQTVSIPSLFGVRSSGLLV
jgi:hypothetical protein